MEIRRINGYADPRFDPEVLRQHGAFLVDGARPCQFRVTGPASAVLDWPDEASADALIEAFRFYAEHITAFYTPDGRLLRQLPAVETFWLDIRRVQPSQFFVDEEKLEAVGSFLSGGGDAVIPVLPVPGEDRYVSCDGHTRLLCALRRGYGQVRAFLTEDNPWIWDFVREARRRRIDGIRDVRALPHEAYTVQWDGFCASFLQGTGR